ncbi:protocadherin beta-15-like [Amia ocellicauda]|uniref:protocadherin beta-15-like n=1 Tax=Amia ocellicauda TaxID=2972642 RepID=UPI003464A192
MDMARMRCSIQWQVRCFIFFMWVIDPCLGDVRYSFPEEMKHGSVIGSLTRDLGIDVRTLSARRARLDFQGSRRCCEINVSTGDLVVAERIDRDTLCGDMTSCAFNFDFFLENPLELHRITVDIQDINDNAPSFPSNIIKLEISESADKGARFPIEDAHDADIGLNSVQSYALESNEYFRLAVHTSAERGKYGELILERELDREKEQEVSLILTAVDGGDPQRSGTAVIQVTVLDVNDNIPVFTETVYKANLPEHCPIGTTVIKVSATDEDDGIYGEVTYEFRHISQKANELFSIDHKTAEVTVIGPVDYEETSRFEIRIQAKDGAGQTAYCKVIIQITDINDNAPVIYIKSLTTPVPEDSTPGTEVAIINIQDRDSEVNSNVRCSIQSFVPFKLVPSIKQYYSLVIDSELDREQISEFNITVTATDEGFPPLSTNQTIHLTISDINDNSPAFDQQSYTAYVTENNSAGSSICSVSATDSDWQQNGSVSYNLLTGEVNGIPVSSIVSINRDSGVIHAVRSFDYEQVRDFKIQVVAKDNGSPQLSSNVTVSVFITDQNDNSPQILYPAQSGNSFMTEMVPKAAQAGSLVSKVIAVDADSGQNAWLSYQIVKSTDPGLFTIGVHSGEIRTQRDISQSDTMKQNLIVLVKDNGQRSHSSTCIVNFVISDDYSDYTSEMKDHAARSENMSNTTAYLVIALAVVTFLFLVFITLILVVKVCRRGKPGLLFDGAVAIPSAHFPPNYAEVEGSGTLRHSYIYDTFLTTGSRTSDFKFVSSYDSTMPRDSTLKKEQKVSNDAEKSVANPDNENCEVRRVSYRIHELESGGRFITKFAM